MKTKFLLLTVLSLSLGWAGVAADAPKHTFEIGAEEFLLDGKPFQIRCGELHFARVPRPYWRHRLRMCRAMGLNAVCAYLFWNYHEQTPGVCDFTGDRDVAAFCRLAQEEGLWVLLRPGPYVCAEWEFGGFPWWLLVKGEESVKVRTCDPAYLEPAKRWLKRVGGELAPLQVTRGGPILMVQVENEYGSYGTDAAYIRELAAATRAAGFDITMFACNGPEQIPNGRVPELFDVVNFGSDPAGSFAALRKYRSTGPLMNGEYYPGWFDSWGHPHHTKPAEKIFEEVGWMLEHRASFSIYMAHGGTTFGWWTGGNTPFMPQTSSYDYEAPISESGEATDKFFRIRELCAKHLNPGEGELPAVPEPIPRAGFKAPCTAKVGALAPLDGKAFTCVEPGPFERQGLGYGVAVYHRVLPCGKAGVLTCRGVRDQMAVVVDGRLAGFLDRRYPDAQVLIPASDKMRDLDLVVMAMGRFNFGHEGLEHAGKGVFASVCLDGEPLKTGWLAHVHSYEEIGRWQNVQDRGDAYAPLEKAVRGPAAVRIRFEAKGGRDTWLDAGGWPFGLAWINGHPLGRYWAIGPTRTMFVPGCWLKDGVNELVVWDLKGFPALKELTFLDHPILDELHPERDLADFKGGRIQGHDSAAEQMQSNGTAISNQKRSGK